MAKIMFLLVFFGFGVVNAEEYMVSGKSVNFRSSANFRGSSNIIKELPEGQRIIMTKDHGNYIEGTLVPEGTAGFVWKDYLDLVNTHDYYKSPSNAFPTVTPESEDPNIAQNSSVGMPLCGCSGCSRSSKYGIRRHPIKKTKRLHAGCDIRAPKGTNVYAMADGKVKTAGNMRGYGKTIDIEHLSVLKGKDGKVISSRGYTTRHAHLWKIHVAKGATVKKGQRIGQVDSTGLSTGHHLHFEIAVPGNITIDPERVIDISDANKSCSTVNNSGTTTTQ